MDIYLVDKKGAIELFNLSKSREKESPLPRIGDRIFLDCYTGAAADLHEILLEAIRSGTPKTIPRVNFENRYYEIRFSPHSEGAAIAFLDLTEQIRTEESLLKSNRRLQQAQKMETLGTLVAGIAHEINNPINMVIYNVPLLQKIWNDFLPALMERAAGHPGENYGGLSPQFLQENLGQLLSDVDLAANRVAKIVQDLKNFAKQTDTSDKKSMQLGDAVNNALRLAQPIVRQSDLELDIDLQPDLPTMEGNIQNIEQIVLNILINGVQSLKGKGGRVEIKTRFLKKEQRLILEISDTGCGINPDLAGKLFDPFTTDKHSEGGSGLGLYVTERLVKSHGGDITFDSRIGKGTTFRISFPAQAKWKPARILVVDDDTAIREILTKFLARNRPYQIDTAPNGIEACIRLGAQHPDLVILDIFMPDMDGLQVCRALKKDPEMGDVKVIITTGYPDHEKLKEVASLGFLNIHYKPFRLNELLAAVDDILMTR